MATAVVSSPAGTRLLPGLEVVLHPPAQSKVHTSWVAGCKTRQARALLATVGWYDVIDLTAACHAKRGVIRAGVPGHLGMSSSKKGFGWCEAGQGCIADPRTSISG